MLRMKTGLWLLIVCFLVKYSSLQAQERKGYFFDASGISKEVMENYLSRSVTMAEFLEIDPYANDGPYPYKGDDVRLIKNIGAKFIGRSIYRWGTESVLNNAAYLDNARQLIREIHLYDKDVVFQAALFEIVTLQVNDIKIPDWAYKAMGIPKESRNFDYNRMLNRDSIFVNQWGKGASVPDISQPESQLWFIFLAGTYMDLGCEAMHLGQTSLMGMADPYFLHWESLIAKLRAYAVKNARRGWILLDAHTPHGGMVVNGKSLLDFNTFPLRIKEIPEQPQMCILEKGYLDALYGRSIGCVTPSGWSCPSLPYLVEFDNFGCSKTPGKSTINNHFVWGYDEITWFYLQSEQYRNEWLIYAYNWIKETDPNGYLQMPVSRIISLCNRQFGKRFRGNTRSSDMPEGLNIENTIKRLWK
ncbi:MAG: hypothetical protein LBQ60_20725 [Bacteroidales bacterium]|nr:hypothetical protein [Bacteroidales bacterium]